MKKLFLFAVAAVALTAACSKQPIQSGSASSPSGFELETPVPVQFASNFARIATKGAGALNYWSAEDLYFYGIERFQDQSGRDSLDLNNLFIANVKETAPNTTDLENPVTEGTVTLHRSLPGGGSEPYYYGNGNYEFFGYYVDDAIVAGSETPVINFSDSTITLPIKIDGTQDIMVGYTDRDLAMSENPLITNKNRLYSAYAIRKWDAMPKMIFKHKLSRFDFSVISGEDAAAGVVNVTGVSVTSDTEADVVVAGQHIYDGLRNVAAQEKLSVPMTAATIPAPAKDGDPAFIGSLMVMPGQSTYEMELSLFQTDATVPSAQPQTMTIDFSKLKVSGTQEKHSQAMPGYKYNITLVVYKFRPVEILVSLEEWKDGGDIVMDPDADEEEVQSGESSGSGEGSGN